MKYTLQENDIRRPVHVPRRDIRLRRFIGWGILGLIVFSPLPAASVYEWCRLVIQGTILAMTLAYLMIGRNTPPGTPSFDSLRWPRRMFTGFALFVLVQLIPFPAVVVRLLSPRLFDLRSRLSGVEEIRFMTLSAVPHRTIHDGLFIFCCMLLGFLIIRTVVTRRQIMRIAGVIVGVGIFEALYGLFELTSESPRILFYAKDYDLGSVTGTFVNRNHLSGYLEMVIPLAIGLIISRIDFVDWSGRKLRDRLLLLAEKGLAVNLLLSMGVVAMSLAVLYSRSRSGVFLLVFGILLISGFVALYFRNESAQRSWAAFLLRIIFIGILLVVFFSGIGSTLERFTRDDLLEEGRISVWGKTLKMVGDFPLAGSGLGTFSRVYMAYDEEGGDVRFSHVHNDYLEYLSELGVPGFIMLLGGVLSLFALSFKAWKDRRRPDVKGLGTGGITGIILILVHSLTDFNLHIPANMLLFTVVLSLTVVTVRYGRSSSPASGSGGEG